MVPSPVAQRRWLGTQPNSTHYPPPSSLLDSLIFNDSLMSRPANCLPRGVAAVAYRALVQPPRNTQFTKKNHCCPHSTKKKTTFPSVCTHLDVLLGAAHVQLPIQSNGRRINGQHIGQFHDLQKNLYACQRERESQRSLCV